MEIRLVDLRPGARAGRAQHPDSGNDRNASPARAEGHGALEVHHFPHRPWYRVLLDKCPCCGASSRDSDASWSFAAEQS